MFPDTHVPLPRATVYMCTVRHMRMRRMLPPMRRIGESGRRVADRRGEAPAVVVEVETSAGGSHRWSVHKCEAHTDAR